MFESVLMLQEVGMFSIMSNALGKAAMMDVISLAALMLGSGRFGFNEVSVVMLLGVLESWSWKGAL